MAANHSTPISLRLPALLLARVDRRVHEDDTDRSTVIRECLERQLPEGDGRPSGSVPARGVPAPRSETADHAAGKAGMPAAETLPTDKKLARAQRAAEQAGLPVKVGV